MKLKYRRFSYPAPFSQKNLFRPIVPISLSNKNISLRFEALIDSGADFCIFPTDIAKKIAINYANLKKIYFSSATGEIVEGFIGKISLDFGEGKFEIKVVFADLTGKTGILGQYGFFDKFKVSFDLKKKEIELKPRK